MLYSRFWLAMSNLVMCQFWNESLYFVKPNQWEAIIKFIPNLQVRINCPRCWLDCWGWQAILQIFTEFITSLIHICYWLSERSVLEGISLCFLMNINHYYVSLETKFCSVCVFLIVTSSRLFALVFDFSALLGNNLNWNSCIHVSVTYVLGFPSNFQLAMFVQSFQQQMILFINGQLNVIAT